MSDIEYHALKIHSKLPDDSNVDFRETLERLRNLVEEYKVPIEEAYDAVLSKYLEEIDTTTDTIKSETQQANSDKKSETADPSVPDLSTVASPPRRSIAHSELNTENNLIGAGGNAVVYEVPLQNNTPPDRIALKEPKESDTLDIETVEQFLHEAATWETLDHHERKKPRWTDSEHIVGVIDTGDKVPWIAMEYMDGGSLRDRLANHPKGLPLDEALWIGECICRGIELAHNYGVAHHDIKPANILFR